MKNTGAFTKLACAQDILLLKQALERNGVGLLATEQFDTDTYLNAVIHKPWGQEYRVYCDVLYDLWKLCIRPGQSTSLHCHPRKVTALLCLAGKGTVHFVDHSKSILPFSWLQIGKGVFHATENTGEGDLELIEVEVPRNKLDLVRAADRYGRAGTTYEQEDLPDYGMYTLDPAHHQYAYQLRQACAHNAYRFDVGSRADLPQCSGDLLFGVSLDVAWALAQEIHIVPRPGNLSAFQGDTTFLIISRQTAQFSFSSSLREGERRSTAAVLDSGEQSTLLFS